MLEESPHGIVPLIRAGTDGLFVLSLNPTVLGQDSEEVSPCFSVTHLTRSGLVSKEWVWRPFIFLPNPPAHGQAVGDGGLELKIPTLQAQNM